MSERLASLRRQSVGTGRGMIRGLGSFVLTVLSTVARRLDGRDGDCRR